jgi:hypothetical protein
MRRGKVALGSLVLFPSIVALAVVSLPIIAILSGYVFPYRPSAVVWGSLIVAAVIGGAGSVGGIWILRS